MSDGLMRCKNGPTDLGFNYLTCPQDSTTYGLKIAEHFIRYAGV